MGEDERRRRKVAAQGFAAVAFFMFAHGARAATRSGAACAPGSQRRRLSGSRRVEHGTLVACQLAEGRPSGEPLLRLAPTLDEDDADRRAEDRVAARGGRAASRRRAAGVRAGTPRSDCRSRCARRASATCSASSGSARIGLPCAAESARSSNGAPAPPGATGLDRPTTAIRSGAAQAGECEAPRDERRPPRAERAAAGASRRRAGARSRSGAPRPTSRRARARSTSSHAAGRLRIAAATSGTAIAMNSRSSGSCSESGAPEPVALRHGAAVQDVGVVRGGAEQHGRREQRQRTLRRARRPTRAARNAPAGT